MLAISVINRVSYTPDGVKSLIRIADGDMRKAINVLQATVMSCGKVNEENVHACTGLPLPRDIQDILNVLLYRSYNDAYGCTCMLTTVTFITDVNMMMQTKSIALIDIVRDLHLLVAPSLAPVVRLLTDGRVGHDECDSHW